MKKMELFALAGGLILTAGLAIAGTASTTNGTNTTSSATQAKASPTVHHEMGTVSSVTAKELTLDHTWKGKQEKTAFTLDSSTKKEGNVAQGEHVTVYYRLEKGQRIATDLKVASSQPKSEAKKS